MTLRQKVGGVFFDSQCSLDISAEKKPGTPETCMHTCMQQQQCHQQYCSFAADEASMRTDAPLRGIRHKWWKFYYGSYSAPNFEVWRVTLDQQSHIRLPVMSLLRNNLGQIVHTAPLIAMLYLRSSCRGRTGKVTACCRRDVVYRV